MVLRNSGMWKLAKQRKKKKTVTKQLATVDECAKKPSRKRQKIRQIGNKLSHGLMPKTKKNDFNNHGRHHQLKETQV